MPRPTARAAALAALAASLVAGAACGGGPAPAPATRTRPARMVQYPELEGAPAPAADHRVAYGPDPALHHGELRLPPGAGPFPVAVLVHGGCWRAEYDLAHLRQLAAALARAGVATWTIEYRRVGDPGGGWPGTFEDVARATDHVRRLAHDHPLDTTRVIAVGHSAGGQLALWLAARAAGRRGVPLPDMEPPLRLRGVVSLAGITDLRAYGDAPGGCNAMVARLLGGPATEQPARYAAASPVELLPLGTPIRLVHGALDPIVPVAQSHDFAERARAAGDDAVATVVKGAGHFDVVASFAPAWSAVERAVLELAAREAR